jgi:hypothetical protein
LVSEDLKNKLKKNFKKEKFSSIPYLVTTSSHVPTYHVPAVLIGIAFWGGYAPTLNKKHEIVEKVFSGVAIFFDL